MDINIVSALIGAIAGGFATYFSEIHFRKADGKEKEVHSASLLYNDLKSIEYYLEHERSSVNIRYSQEWQNMIASCYFLNGVEVEYLYKIYDSVYNYNYHYRAKEEENMSFEKENIREYKELQKLIFDYSKNYVNLKGFNERYAEIIKKLKRIIKSKYKKKNIKFKR